MGLRSLILRVAGAMFVLFLLCAGYASATPITVNKTFTPGSVNLGQASSITVTFQNNDTLNTAAISAFKDDIATMAGGAIVNTAVTPTTTCAGGTPSISGTAIVMNNGVIPQAPSPATPGSCTLTFSVIGAIAGNSVNTIRAADVNTSLGGPPGDVSQTLAVVPVNIAITAGPSQTVLVTAAPNTVTTTLTYTITNPTSNVPLTNVAFPINLNTAGGAPPYMFTVTSASTSCGGTASLPPTGATGTVNFSGVTVPAGGKCTVSVVVTSNATTTNAPNTINATLPSSGSCGIPNPQRICTSQGITNSGSASNTAKFVVGNPNVSKNFNPNAIQQGMTTTLTINVANILSDQALTNAAIFDNLPAGLAVANPANAKINGTGCSGTFAPAPGATAVALSNGTIPPATTCSLVVTVIANSLPVATNVIPKGNFTSTQVNGAAADASANLTVTGPGGAIAVSKSVTYPPPSTNGVGPFTAVTFSIKFTSVAGGTTTNASFTDTLPQTPQNMEVVGFPLGVTGAQCGGTITAPFHGLVASGTGITVPAGGSCTVVFTAQFTSIPPGVSRTNTNTVVTSAGNASANVVALPVLTLSNYSATTNNGQSLVNQPVTVSATINNPSGVQDTNVHAVFTLTPGKVQLAANPNFKFGAGCPPGLNASNITIGANGESFVLYAPTINASCTISYDVVDEGGVAGTFTPGNSYYTSALTNCPTGGPTGCPASQNFPGTLNVNFQQTNIALSKTFAPNQIQAGSTSVAAIILGVAPVPGFTTTIADGVSVPDTLPAGLQFAPVPNVTFSPGCGPSPAYSILGTTITASNITLSTATGNCTFNFSVTSNVLGAPVNRIAAGAVKSISGVTNSQAVAASLTVAAGVAIQKTFLQSPIPIGSTTYMRLLLTNSASPTQLTGGTLTDNMPGQVALAGTALGPQQPGDPALCGGAIAGTIGASTFKLTGVTIPGVSGTSPGQCVFYVPVGASTTAAPGTPYINTIPAGGLVIGAFANQTPASAPIAFTAPPNPTLSKAFSPIAIPVNGVSVLTITVANTAAGAAPLSGMSLTDDLPASVVLAPAPNASTTCTGGTVTAVAGATSVALSGGTVAAAATCTITVSVTSAVTGFYLNTIPANALKTTQGATNAAPASATLNVGNASAVSVTKVFAPATIAPGANSTLTISLANTAPTAIALSGVGLSDTLPTNVTLAATPNAATTCPGGSVATSGAATIVLSGANLAKNATCTITVTVTSSAPGTWTNTIPQGTITSVQGATNSAPATAPLTVVATPLTLAKSFTPAAIITSGTSVLTITVNNSAPGSINLSGLALSDGLPGPVRVATAPNAATTCGPGTVTAVAGTASIALSGGSVAAGATCTISVTVTSPTPGTFPNSIPAGNVTSTQNVTNSNIAAATLNVSNAPNVTLSKIFAPAAITQGGTSTLTVSIANTAPGAVALSSLGLTDGLPANVIVAATPNAATTCPGGTPSATAGGTSVTLANGTLAAGATCTLSVNVTSSTVGTWTNTIPPLAVTSAQGATNPQQAQAPLTVNAPSGVTIAKSFTPPSIISSGTSVLSVTINNTGPNAVNLSALSLTDTLPASVTIAATPNGATTCGPGTVAATPGGPSVALSGATLAAGATCAFSVNVTSQVPGSYVNTIGPGAVSTAQNVSNAGPATATLTVTNAPAVSLSKSFAPTLIAPGAASTLTISIVNTAAGAVPLSALALTDTLPANITVAAAPHAATTCVGGTATATPGGTTVALTGGTLGAGAGCTVTVSVTGTISGTYTNTIPVKSVSSAQGATNTTPATAPLTIGAPSLSVTKTSNPSGANVSPGQTIVYTIAVTNTGSLPETNAHITDTLTNATLVPGSVTVNGAPAPDAVVTSGQPFGTIAPGATTTVVYSATVNANATNNAQVANNVVIGGDQPCTGASCSAISPPNIVKLPSLAIAKVVDGKLNETVVHGQTVVYGITVTNQSAVSANGVTVTDVAPAGVTPIAGTVTLNGSPLSGATVNGQTITAPIGKLAGSASALITFKATITATSGSATNTASVAGAGIPALVSNPATVTIVPPTLVVNKTASATTAQAGDRVDFSIVVTPANGLAYGLTTIVDTLPAYQIYAPGTARVAGKPQEPVVSGRTLTWTLPSLTSAVTITYSAVVAPGAPAGSVLTNTVDVTATPPGGAPPGRGSASASVLVTGTTLGSCYPITGRVFFDANGTGRFDDPDVGLANVHIYLDNGQSVVTDSTGRYNFPCVHPGMHALRLDESTLPPGMKPFDDRNMDSPKSIRRLVHAVNDTTIIQDINFAVTGSLPQPSPSANK